MEQVEHNPVEGIYPADDYVQDFVSDVDRTRGLTAGAIMQSPWLTAPVHDDPGTVLARVRKARGDGVYVLDDDGRIVGVATSGTLARAHAGGAPDLRGCLVEDFEVISDDTPINEFCHLTGGHAVPVAVVGGERPLVGVVGRGAGVGPRGAGGGAGAPPPRFPVVVVMSPIAPRTRRHVVRFYGAVSGR
jgi:ABC-type proline/glycine betaine transport system ATPase subunit